MLITKMFNHQNAQSNQIKSNFSNLIFRSLSSNFGLYSQLFNATIKVDLKAKLLLGHFYLLSPFFGRECCSKDEWKMLIWFLHKDDPPFSLFVRTTFLCVFSTHSGPFDIYYMPWLSLSSRQMCVCLYDHMSSPTLKRKIKVGIYDQNFFSLLSASPEKVIRLFFIQRITKLLLSLLKACAKLQK